MAHAVADWLAGRPWFLSGAHWVPYGAPSVCLEEDGDALTFKGLPILRRDPPALVPIPGGKRTTPAIEAHAVCAVALRGDHRRLYPRHRLAAGVSE